MTTDQRAIAELRNVAKKLTDSEREHLAGEAIARAVGRLRGLGLSADSIAGVMTLRAVRLMLETREASEVAVWLAELADELDPLPADGEGESEAATIQASAAREALDILLRHQRWQDEERAARALPLPSRRADGRGHRRPGFAAAMAAETGLSRATVNRRLRRALAIDGEVLDEILGTRWNRSSTLDVLGTLAHSEQRAVMELLASGAARSVPEARDLVLGRRGRGAPNPGSPSDRQPRR